MPTALLAAEDSIALSLLRIFHGAGLRVPGDLSIVGIDDIPASGQAFPPLTTLRQPIGEMASAAFSAVLGRLRKSVSIPGKLIVRESCGPVRPDTPIPRI
jgi:DNA-binding LacI/PurR family transcriptional regulator